MELAGKRVLVTGGAVRIGRGICEALAARGCHLAIHCRDSSDEATGLAERVRSDGGTAVVVQAALDVEATCREVVDEAWAALGGLDALVNNAAVFHKDSLLETTVAKLETEFSVNLYAPILLSRAFAEHVTQEGEGGLRGRIINLLDRRIRGHETDCLPYLLSKKMLAAFTLDAARELAPEIAVNGVAPGAVLPPPGKDEAYVKDLAGTNPLAHQCTVEEVAEAVVFLLASDAITGQIIFVDGGQHLKR